MVARALVTYTVCLILALLSVSGAHLHAHAIGHHDHEAFQAASPEFDHQAADELDHATADIDANHLGDHEHHHAVDIDRGAKAFGKHSINSPVWIPTLWSWVCSVGIAPRDTVITCAPPLRPPQPPSRFYVFPPSHAPPALLA